MPGRRAHDNSRFASCGGDRSVFYWDVNTGHTIKRFQGHSGRVNTVAFNFESTILASGKLIIAYSSAPNSSLEIFRFLRCFS